MTAYRFHIVITVNWLLLVQYEVSALNPHLSAFQISKEINFFK